MAKRPFQLPGTGSTCNDGDDVVKIEEDPLISKYAGRKKSGTIFSIP